MLYKSGTLQGHVITSSSVYVCGKCGYTEIINGDIDSVKKCASCSGEMSIISSHASTKDNDSVNNGKDSSR